MNRREFFSALSGGVAASAALPLLPISAPPLAFTPDAFRVVASPDGTVGWYFDGNVKTLTDAEFNRLFKNTLQIRYGHKK